MSSIAATENGVSTSAVRNPAAYMSPWSYLPETSDASKAWKSLVEAVQQVDDRIVLEKVIDRYLHATVPTERPPIPGGGGIDDLEFLLRPEDNLVLFRSASRTSIFVYPVQQPVSDGNSNRKRLERIRQTLGWQEL